MNNLVNDKVKTQLDEDGFIIINSVLTEEELKQYSGLYEDIISGRVNTQKHRHDLGSHAPLTDGLKENICQVMWPIKYLDGGLEESVLHKKVIGIAKRLLGEDMVFDFDMLISKEAGSKVETPWHQDESYWLDMPDKRALSFWFPMEDTTTENGCMWFIKGSHIHEKGLRPHRSVTEGMELVGSCYFARYNICYRSPCKDDRMKTSWG